MNIHYFLLILLFSACSSDSKTIEPITPSTKGLQLSLTEEVENTLNYVAEQYKLMIPSVPEGQFPRNTEENGTMRSVSSSDWTSGFYPGILWYLYEYTKDEEFKLQAEIKTLLIKDQMNNTGTHDLGFMLYNSFGHGYRLTNNNDYKDVLLTGAMSLSSRYNEKVGCIKSWDWADQWRYPVIIGNMMNLEYLFWAYKETDNNEYYAQAVSHADTTLLNHYRNNNSCYHVLDYNPDTGRLISKTNLQGLNDESIWSRGQAWGLYGFVMMYRETNDKKYLDHVYEVIELIFSHPNMPSDMIPYWDYSAPILPNTPRDASAAAILASALLELIEYSDDTIKKECLEKVERIFSALFSSQYLNKLGSNNNFVLRHATGNHPSNSEIDTEIIYADYYFIEALIRYSLLK